MSKVKLMTQAEYATHRGVSAVAVHKAVKAQRISTIDGKIDPIVADIQWQANTRPRAVRPLAPDPQTSAADYPPPVPIPAPVASAAGEPVDDYWVSRARREAAEAQIAEMKRSEIEGTLIRTDALRQAWSKRIATTRDALLQIPARMAPVLAAESDMDRVAAVLEDELRQALAELSRDPMSEVG